MDSKTCNIEAARRYHLAIRKDQEIRNEYIYLASTEGASTREIARELNLTHGYVARIIRKRKEES